MPITLSQYYNRYESHEQPLAYEQHLFLAGNVLQSAELNEIQARSRDHLRRVTDALFLDGNILSGADILLVDQVATCEAGAVYLDGLVRGVPQRVFTLPSTTIRVGVYLAESIISPTEDVLLRDPAISANNFQETGASRLQVNATWGYEGEPGKVGQFYTVYRVEDGVVLNHAAPPQVNAADVAISRYDRQSTGGFYVSRGMMVRKGLDAGDTQVFVMGSGDARVNGVELYYRQDRSFRYTPTVSTTPVISELFPVIVATGADQAVTVAHSPLSAVTRVSVVRQVTETVTHGVAGGEDTLAHDSITALVSVVQGGTTYTSPADFTRTGSVLDWSAAGAEPASGSQYQVVYRFNDAFTPASITETGFTVTGTTLDAQSRSLTLVNGSDITTDYTYKIPRYDVLCLNSAGEFVMIAGVPAVVRPRIPTVPSSLLRLAIIEQRWSAATRVINAAVRMVPMSELNAVNDRIDTLFALVAEERLTLNLTQRDNSAKKGVFVDPFFDDDLRDQGLPQDAAIFRSELTLGVVDYPRNLSLPANVALDMTLGPAVIDQPLKTGSMKIQPYVVFRPIPGEAMLFPAVDFWTAFETEWTSPITRQFDEDPLVDGRVDFNVTRLGVPDRLIVSPPAGQTVVTESQFTGADVEKVGTRYTQIKFLRSIPVRFELSGFGVDEELWAVYFDGKLMTLEPVTP